MDPLLRFFGWLLFTFVATLAYFAVLWGTSGCCGDHPERGPDPDVREVLRRDIGKLLPSDAGAGQDGGVE